MCLPHSDDFQHALARAFILVGGGGIPFFHEDKIHEHNQKSLLLGKRTKGNFACCFRSFLQVFERDFQQKISYFDGKE